MDAKKIAEIMMDIMTSQKFADWYEQQFVEMIQDSQGPQKKDVQAALEKMILAKINK